MSKLPTQFEIENITIDGQDVTALMVDLEIFENIFIPVVTGSVTILDSSGASFIDEYKIEFNEPFEFTVRSAKDETLTFKGNLNGQGGEQESNDKKLYKIDFTSEEMRTNDQTFINKRFKVKAEEVLKEMIESVEGDIDLSEVQTKPMEFVAARWKPFHVIKYVLENAVTDNASASKKDEKEQEEEAKGTTGLLLWQIIGEDKNKYRSCSVDELIKGKFETHGPFDLKKGQSSSSDSPDYDGVVSAHHQNSGDIKTKMASGAFRSINVSFDMDTGAYKEYEYDGKDLMTDKQYEIVTKPTRVLMKPFTNERFTNDCEKAQPNTGDQSRESLQQNNSRQNTFNDQTGRFTLYPQFKIHAGDIVEMKINKVKSGAQKSNEDEKHSGQYVVKQVSHHFNNEGKAYTQVTTIRSTTQQDKQTAKSQ
jgi:hypothetical protein